MPKAVTEIRSLARSYTRSALRVLVGVMGCKDATPAARVAAANAILDRGWGRPTQALEGTRDGALELIHRIERVIGRTRSIGANISSEKSSPNALLPCWQHFRPCNENPYHTGKIVGSVVLVDLRK
jgi:hypothetical protein